MTDNEYNNLKYKITTRDNENKILSISLGIILACLTGSLGEELEIKGVFLIAMGTFLLVLFLMVKFMNPWHKKRPKQLNELYKTNTSYQQAFKVLKLDELSKD